jgi:membrane-associated phospholipid phosphatase
VALYAAIAQTPTRALDRARARLSRAADRSRLSLAAAAVLAATGGRQRRRAATMGLASVAVTSGLVNLGMKPLGRRRRPDRAARRVPVARHVRMPSSTSFPSGHSAAAFAFATGVGGLLRRDLDELITNRCVRSSWPRAVPERVARPVQVGDRPAQFETLV